VADVIFFFANNTDTMIATKALKDAGVRARMIPRPPTVDAASNLCLTIDGGNESAALRALETANIALGGVVK
jgi:hypothetical protein